MLDIHIAYTYIYIYIHLQTYTGTYETMNREIIQHMYFV